MATDLALLRLLQLVSPQLPIGAYAYSQGMEYAVQAEWVCDEADVQAWLHGVLCHGLAQLDVPVLLRLYRAWDENDLESIEYWSRCLRASRESAELQAEDRHLGMALARLLTDIKIEDARSWMRAPHVTLATMFSLAATRWGIRFEQAATGYLYAWAENQVAAAIKLVPLGQTAGQRILSAVMSDIVTAVRNGMQVIDTDIGFAAPRLAIGSALHESQYSRLFRS
jgi:urease accessory protein